MESTDVIAKLINYGLLAPIVIVLWRAYTKLQKDLQDAQQQRVIDAERCAERTHAAVDAIRENTAVLRAAIAAGRAQPLTMGVDDALDETPVKGRRTGGARTPTGG